MSKISGEMKEVINATLSQSKEINSMQYEIGDIYSMLKKLCNHLMPNSLPLPLPQPTYVAIRTNNATNTTDSPINMLPPGCTSPFHKKQNTGEVNNLQISHLTVPGIHETCPTSDPRARADVATP
jgi:hypothetical protein